MTGSLAAGWRDRLRPDLADYARVALDNIGREFPAHVSSMMTAPGDFPFRPRDRNPVFYGSLDWHSCVEMFWVLVRLLKTAPGDVPASGIRDALDARLTPEGLQAEADFMATPHGAAMERPYGWGWALALGSFGISMALPYADRQPGGELSRALRAAASRWFGADEDYPGAWEPSGQDFLSPALCEAELMARMLPREDFPGWLARFLPGIAGEQPSALFTPAVVTDSADGYLAHLRGLNLSRAWCWRRLAETLPADDSRVAVCARASGVHAEASLGYVTGDDYMVEHWLAAYAVLLFS